MKKIVALLLVLAMAFGTVACAAPAAPAGTGAALLAAIESLARERGIAGLQLCASRNALSFYLRHGYAIITPAKRELTPQVSLPVCLMAKSLVP